MFPLETVITFLVIKEKEYEVWEESASELTQPV